MDFLKPVALGAAAIAAASATGYQIAKTVLGSREPKNEQEKAEERQWLSSLIGDKDAAAVCCDEVTKNAMIKLRMYRHFHKEAYRGLAKSLAAVIRVRRHMSSSRANFHRGSPIVTQKRYITASRRALEDLMGALKAREGDPAENGYDEAAEIAETLSDFLEQEFTNLAWATDRQRDL